MDKTTIYETAIKQIQYRVEYAFEDYFDNETYDAQTLLEDLSEISGICRLTNALTHLKGGEE